MNSVEDFRGDYAQLAAVMEASWQENAAAPFLYTAEFLADCFRCSGSSFALAPTIYHDSELVAFVAGFPRLVLINGEERRVLIVAFLTAAPEHKDSGYGIVVWSELMRRAAAAGFDGVVNYCVEGEAMHRMIVGSCRRLGLPVLRVASIHYLSRVLFSKASVADAPRGSASVEPFLHAAARVAQEVSLARTWTAEEASWQLTRVGSVSVLDGANTDPAVLTGYIMPVADRNRTRCLIVEDTFWGGLTSGRRTRLAHEFTAKAASAGARLAIVPIRGYADAKPFVASGFRPSQKLVHAYLTLWTGSMPEEPLSGYYLDVF